MRILVVEDEMRMAKLIRQGLKEDHYAVDMIHNGAEVFDWVSIANYDMLVLDLMLPGMDGLEVCQKLRKDGYTMPIIMLTARDSLSDKVIGLDSGADDYLAKPFAIEELTARLRALARRDGPSKTILLTVGDLRLDTTTKQAQRGELIIDLTAKEYMLLETLMHHPNQIMSREQIIDHVWNMEFESGSKLIEVYIHALRKKIDDGFEVKYIHTIRGLGYRISDRENA